MNVHRIRPRKRWRVCMALAAAVFLVLRCAQSTEEHRLKPNDWMAVSGEYPLQGVGSDGSVEVLVHTDRGSRIAKVMLLAVEVPSTSEVAAQVRQIIGTASTVRLRFDRRRTTEDTRELQAYVYVEHVSVNEELVRLGLAKEDTHPSDAGPMVRRIKKAEQEAREQRRGVWSSP